MNKLLGNDMINRELSRGLKGHAYMLCGEAGMGKRTLARLMAAQITEDSKGKALRDEHPDVLWLAPEEEGKMIKVDQVREFRNQAYVTPNEAPKKVLIITHCELLNDGGQNAVLKVLEEPPSHAVFILLTPNREVLLPTVRSRCTIWELQPVGEAQGLQYLQERHPEAENLRSLLRAAEGNLGRAEEYLAGGTLMQYGEMGVRFLGRLCRNKSLEADQLLSSLPKGDFSAFLDSFARLTRDFLLYKTGSDLENIVFSESVLQIKPFLGRMKLEQLYRMALLTKNSKDMLSNYGNENLVKTCFIAEMGELVN